jgi:hypothetical protein
MRILILVFLVLGIVAKSWAEPIAEQSDRGAKTLQQTSAQISNLPVTNQTSAQTSTEASIKTPKQVPPQSPTTGQAQAKKKPAVKTPSVTFQSLKQMNQLIRLGVPALAFSLLQDEQKKRPQFTADWYTFEYKRIILLSALERWQQLIDRTQWLFEAAKSKGRITKKIRLWFETQQVIARLQLKQSDIALKQLQRMLWQTEAAYRDASLPAVWRRLVIRSYLQLQQDDDARRALIKYEHDYQSDDMDIDWVLLQAQLLLKTNRPQQSIALLQQLPDQHVLDVEALLLIATLQASPKNAASINQQMRAQLDGQILSKATRWAYSYVAYLASTVLSDLDAQILNAEAMLSLAIETPILGDDYSLTADDLWSLYNKQGMMIANDKGLLLGNDAQWEKVSEQLISSQPEKALSLNATWALHSKNLASQQQQHKIIVQIIEQRKNGLKLINQLYLHSNKVKDIKVLPEEIRFRLVDYALSEGDYSAAANIMKSLVEPPPGKTLFDWRMRKARVLVLQGEYKNSEDLILKTFTQNASISHAELDRYIQVVFDFQTVQQHQQALKLFDLISIEGLDEKLKREIYFWKAESYYSLEKYDRAALYYLESARAVSESIHDLWAQSARFKAGQSLVKAKIYDDAKKVLTDLLRITASDSRKALINQQLQKIRLLKSTVKK